VAKLNCCGFLQNGEMTYPRQDQQSACGIVAAIYLHICDQAVHRVRADRNCLALHSVIREAADDGHRNLKFNLFNGVRGFRTYIGSKRIRRSGEILMEFIMSNTAVKIASVCFVILALPTASFARGGGGGARGGGSAAMVGAGRPNAAAIGAAQSQMTDPSGIGNASRVAPIPPPRISVPTIPQFK
jgi:hypothetical protein